MPSIWRSSIRVARWAAQKSTCLVEDDAVKPGQGKQIADRFLKGEGVKLFTGIIFSNVAAAIVPDILEGGGTYTSA